MTLYARLMHRVSQPDALLDGPCWTWQNALLPGGYGCVTAPGHESRLAHRVAYELAIGPIPDGLVIDHTHCLRGHELSGTNLVPSWLRKGRRGCLTCNRAQSQAYRNRRNVAA